MARERLQKVLARAGIASRRAAEELIVAGRVSVNGVRASIGDGADPRVDRIELDGRAVGGEPAAVHYAIHKPRGILSSARDERGRRSVVSLLAGVTDTRLWPAGRLDADSEGLMLLTNDGDWANQVLHPRFGTVREYAALVDPAPTRAQLDRLRAGIELDDGPAQLLSARFAAPPPAVERLGAERGAWLAIRVGEGRKREVRRLFDVVGCRVERLVRTRIGPLALDGLRSGEFRRLSSREIRGLAAGARSGRQ
jgi:23S rRNA pseudouridine2605 synthase